MTTPDTDALTAAIQAATKRTPVFPCAAGDKNPLTEHGFKDATTDWGTIRAWWAKWPTANLAIPTGERSGLIVLDVDMNDGSDGKEVKDGEASLSELTAKHGSLPPTLEVKTPRGGRHLYFRHPGQKVPSRGNHPLRDLDIRGDGGYVLIPPSTTERGAYTSATRTAPAECPPWLLALLLNGTAPAEKPHPVTPSPSFAPSADPTEEEARIRDALRSISAGDYDTWTKIGMALHAWDPQRGFGLWAEWSRTCPEKYDERQPPKKWASFKADRPGGVKLGTLFEHAKRGGWMSPPPPMARIGGGKPETVAASGNKSDEEVFARLAQLPPVEYDRQRETEAEKLKIRVATLDAEVAKRRKTGDVGLQGGAVDFPAVTPWADPVEGAAVLDAVAAAFARYVVLPPHTADILALWTAHAHAFAAFQHTPRLNLASPEKQCGKSLVIDVLIPLVPRPLRTESITPAVLFRMVDQHKPVLLLDEVDTYLDQNDELRGLLNAGHKRGAKAYRCEGDRNEVRGFDAFAPAVLAGIGTLPGTLHDRSVIVRLVRAKPGEVPIRFDSRRTAPETEICRKLARWVADNVNRLAASDPTMPDGAFNRLADNWRPLFAVAEIAGGDWPIRAATAFASATKADDLDAHGIGAALLADVRMIFRDKDCDRLPSASIVEALVGMEGKPWPEFRHGKPITPNQLARLLSRFGVRSKSIRIGAETPKGYMLADFEDAFARYLPPPPSSDRNTATTPENIDDPTDLETPHEESVLRFENGVSANNDGACGGVAVQKGVCREQGDSDRDQPAEAVVEGFFDDFR